MGKLAKQPLGRPRQRLDETNKTEFKAIHWEVVEYLLWLRTGTSGGILCETVRNFWIT